MSFTDNQDEAFTWGPGGSQTTSAQRAAYARALLAKSMDTSPVQHPLQGLARVAQAIAGALQMKYAQDDAAAENAADASLLGAAFGGFGGQASPAAAPGATAAAATPAVAPEAVKAMILGQVPKDAPEGMGDYLVKLAGKESSWNPDNVSPTGAKGLFQFTRGTGAQYGLLGQGGDMRGDPTLNTQAAIRFTMANREGLRNALGREPTWGEVALAHQQGLGGALALLHGRSAAPGNLAVNGIDPRTDPRIAAQKIMSYYDMPGGSAVAGAAAPPVASGTIAQPMPPLPTVATGGAPAAVPPAPASTAPAPAPSNWNAAPTPVAAGAPTSAVASDMPVPVAALPPTAPGFVPPGPTTGPVLDPTLTSEGARQLLHPGTPAPADPAAPAAAVAPAVAPASPPVTAAPAVTPVPPTPAMTSATPAATPAAPVVPAAAPAPATAAILPSAAIPAPATTYGPAARSGAWDPTIAAQGFQPSPSFVRGLVGQALRTRAPAGAAGGPSSAAAAPVAPGAVPAAGGAPGAAPGGAGLLRAGTDPRQVQIAMRLSMSQNPGIRAVGTALLNKLMTPPQLQSVTDPGSGRQGTFNSQTGTYDYGPGGAGGQGRFRPATPEDLAKNNLPAGTPAQVDTLTGEIKPIPSNRATPTTSKDLRDTIVTQPIVRALSTARSAYNTMFDAAGDTTGASDLAFGYGFAQVMDPNSIVRSEEQEAAGKVGSVAATVQGIIQRYTGGAGITPQNREQLLKTARDKVLAVRGEAQKTLKPFRSAGDRAQIAPEDYMPDGLDEDVPVWKAPAAPATTGDGSTTTPATTPAATPAPTGPLKTPTAPMLQILQDQRQRGDSKGLAESIQKLKAAGYSTDGL